MSVLQDLTRIFEHTVPLETVHEVHRLLHGVVDPDVADLGIDACVLPVFDLEKSVIAKRLYRRLFLVLLHEVVRKV